MPKLPSLTSIIRQCKSVLHFIWEAAIFQCHTINFKIQ